MRCTIVPTRCPVVATATVTGLRGVVLGCLERRQRRMGLGGVVDEKWGFLNIGNPQKWFVYNYKSSIQDDLKFGSPLIIQLLHQQKRFQPTSYYVTNQSLHHYPGLHQQKKIQKAIFST